MRKNQAGFGIFEGFIVFIIVGLIVFISLTLLNSKKNNDAQSKATIDTTINEIVASVAQDPKPQLRQVKGCGEANHGKFDKPTYHCYQILDILYQATTETALTLLTNKQKIVEKKLVDLGYEWLYGTTPTKGINGGVYSYYSTIYSKKPYANCEIRSHFPANEPGIAKAYPETYKNLADIHIECLADVAGVKDYFYSGT